MTARAGVAAVLLLAVGAAGAAEPPARPAPGWHEEQVFDRHSPLAAKWEFARRVLAPTTYDRLRRYQEASGVEVAEHALDLRQERFDLYVPAEVPPSGYGLLVFVSPMPHFPVPRDWKREFDRRGIVFVVARRSGNSEDAIERRMPLALHAHENVAARLPLDPERIHVAGFSGGSRIAQRLALAYPDVFRGAILFASSDPFGAPGVRQSEAPLSPPLGEFMDVFRERSRVVFATGSQDLPNRARDARTRESLREYCVPHVAVVSLARLDHWVPDGRGLARALDALSSDGEAGAIPADCVARLQQRIDGGLDRVAALLAAGQAQEAGIALGEVETRFGGLAAPRSVDLSREIARALGGGG